MNFTLLMDKAKAMLAGKWSQAAIATLVYYLITCAISMIGTGIQSSYVSGIGTAIQILVYGPLTFGYILFLACLVDTNVSNFELLFRGFSRLGETMLAGILYYVLVAIGMVLLIVPGIILSFGLSMTFYIMVDDPNISAIDALKLSWNLMKGHKMDFFMLQLHFIGWAILCLFTCGIGLLWLLPYIFVTNLNFYRNIRYGIV